MKKYIDLTGLKIGKLSPIELSNDMKDSNGTTKLWKCKCDCGNITYKSARKLNEAIKLNRNLSCGCAEITDFIGKIFGDYKVIKFLYSTKKHRYWQCQCVCGDLETKSTAYLTQCNYVCEKLKKANTKYRNKIRRILYSMKRRCYDTKNKEYKNYGGRKISICDEWLKNSDAFVDWAINNGYKEGLSIDRIDNNGNYEPNNCRWTDVFTQANNKTTNLKIEYNGEIKNLKQWCRELELPYRKTHKRLYLYGWSVDRCFKEKERVGFI